MARAPVILVFDSGFGGLTVFREVVKARPDAEFVYCADDAAFPYGALTEPRLIERVIEVFSTLIADFAPDLAVIACNTASTLVLPHLRERFAIPFVGTVPAVKPAAAASRTRKISVLATPGTVKRDYTRDLIERFASDCEVTLVGAPRLAPLTEAKLRGEEVSDAEILAEITPCFHESPDGRRTDHVVLACTHYPLIADDIARLAPWPVTLIDPAPAIARRVVALIGPAGPPRRGHDHAALFTGCVPQKEAERVILAGFGVGSIASLDLPLTAPVSSVASARSRRC